MSTASVTYLHPGTGQVTTQTTTYIHLTQTSRDGTVRVVRIAAR